MQWHDVQQNTEAWDELRLGKVTASQFNCFMANQQSDMRYKLPWK